MWSYHQATAVFKEASTLLPYVNERLVDSCLDKTYVGRLLITGSQLFRARPFALILSFHTTPELYNVRLLSSDFGIQFSVHTFSFMISRARASSHRLYVLSNAANRLKLKIHTRIINLVSTIVSLKHDLTVLLKQCIHLLCLPSFQGRSTENSPQNLPIYLLLD